MPLKRNRSIFLLAGLLAFAISSLAEEHAGRTSAPESDGQFSLYRQAVNDAADRMLNDMQSSVPSAKPNLPESPGVRGDSQVEWEDRTRHFAEKFWMGRGASLQKALTRLNELRPSVEPLLREEGVPSDLVAIVLIESSAQGNAESPRGARGLWQLMPATAQRYGLRVNGQVDDRLDQVRATHAAARYLRDLHLRFGDWLLALAAYNAGENAVQRAIGRTGKAEFWTLSDNRQLPTETRIYVPAVLAAIQLLGNSNSFFADQQRGRQEAKSDARPRTRFVGY